mgnify:CR=1 FL=1
MYVCESKRDSVWGSDHWVGEKEEERICMYAKACARDREVMCVWANLSSRSCVEYDECNSLLLATLVDRQSAPRC